MNITANMPQHGSEPADEAQHTADDDQLATGNAHSASKKISETKSGLSKLLQIKSLTAILIGLFIVLVIALVSRRKR
nr:hypothetical protein [Psychrobacter sp. PraFG1]UNK06640.1 hypothetical protein MN210_13630 [Psychrobacter sp. PraFG1]